MSEVSTASPVIFEKPILYDVTLLTTPRTVIPYDVGVTILGNTTLGVCRIAVKTLGHNIPATKHDAKHEFGEMNWVEGSSDPVDVHYYDKAVLDLGNVANIGKLSETYYQVQ